MKAKSVEISEISDEEVKRGINLLKSIFLPQQEEWERNGVDHSCISAGSYAAEDIDAMGEYLWLRDRRRFLEDYFQTPKSQRRKTDIAVIVAMKIFEFQGKRTPGVIHFGKLKKALQDRLDWREMSAALDFLVDGLFIGYYAGNIDSKSSTNGLIKFTEEISDEMKIN